MGIDFQQYAPPGPIGGAFIEGHGPIDMIMGPGGSGKTVASVIKGPRLAAAYAPVCKDGWVRVKTLCVRDTYRDFARTALASWYNMWPEKHPWTQSHEGGQDRPVRHVLAWRARRGGDMVNIEYTMETGAPGQDEIEGFYKGYEITYGWGNEIDIQHENTLPLMLQRCGRFPPVSMIADSELARCSRDGRKIMEMLGLTVEPGEIVLPRIVWADFNPPDIDNHAFKTGFGEGGRPGQIIRNHTPGYNGFWQPGGLSPNAENRIGKPRSSYELEVATTPDKSLVRRMVHSMPAYAKDGRPVYEDEFNSERHVADQPLRVVREWGLTIGVDAGGNPAASIGQISPYGQNRLVAELVSSPGTGPTRFGQMLITLLMTRFPGFPIIGAWGDPSAFYGLDKVTDEFHWMNEFMKAVRFNIQPAPSNEPSIRHEAVKYYLNLNLDGMTPGYIIDPSCKRMQGGFAAHYKLSKQNSEQETDKIAVIKNKYSHCHDAEQYRCLGFLGLANLSEGISKQVLPGNVVNLNQQRLRQQQPAQRDRMDFNI